MQKISVMNFKYENIIDNLMIEILKGEVIYQPKMMKINAH